MTLHRIKTLEHLKSVDPERIDQIEFHLALQLIEEQQQLIKKLAKKSSLQRKSYRDLQRACEKYKVQAEGANTIRNATHDKCIRYSVRNTDLELENKTLREAFEILNKK